jgi:S-adenosylmethionine:tRNA ribosyltransferase-isomerase
VEKLMAAKENSKPIVSVGPTSMRTLESLYWMGVKAADNQDASLQDLEIKQWDGYELRSSDNALSSLLHWMKVNRIERILCKTQIIIAPPYKPKVVNALVTNFHQPNSTLLLLVAAVVGNDWKKIYDYALHHNFRFLSYGDGSLLFVK